MSNESESKGRGFESHCKLDFYAGLKKNITHYFWVLHLANILSEMVFCHNVPV